MGISLQSIPAAINALIAAEPVLIAMPNRRERMRFVVREPVRYRLLRAKGFESVGVGETVDISSSGILFTTSEPLPVGRLVEVSVNWPAQLDGRVPLQLVAVGPVVRATDTKAAVRVRGYEFKVRPVAVAAGASLYQSEAACVPIHQ
jgi:PilZ domain-containing protein